MQDVILTLSRTIAELVDERDKFKNDAEILTHDIQTFNKDARNKERELSAALNDYRDEISLLKSQLQTTNARIEALQAAKYDDTHFTNTIKQIRDQIPAYYKEGKAAADMYYDSQRACVNIAKITETWVD